MITVTKIFTPSAAAFAISFLIPASDFQESLTSTPAAKSFNKGER